MRFVIHENKILTTQTRRTVAEFAQLTKTSTERKLKPAEAKRIARLQTQLLRAGIISPVNQELVRQQARALYHSLPWWKKLRLRVRFHIKLTLMRIEAFWLQLQK